MSTDIQGKLEAIANNGLIAASIALGKKLKLFDALAEVGSEMAPATAKRIAHAAGCKERYVKEFLSTMACAGLIEVTPDERFWMNEEQAKALLGRDNRAVAECAYLPALLKNYHLVLDAFREQGRRGIDYAEYEEFFEAEAVVTESMHRTHLINDFIPLVGLKEKLEIGSLLLDVGCGSGFQAIQIASAFPKSTVKGMDICAASIEWARKKADGLENVSFLVANAEQLNREWTDSFDVVTLFAALHDQQRPDLILKEVHRVLKPTGTLVILEVSGTSNILQDKKDPRSARWYALSTFQCLPVTCNTPDALALGAKIAVPRMHELLLDAGFAEAQIRTVDVPFYNDYVAIVCHKGQ